MKKPKLMTYVGMVEEYDRHNRNPPKLTVFKAKNDRNAIKRLCGDKAKCSPGQKWEDVFTAIDEGNGDGDDYYTLVNATTKRCILGELDE